MNFLTTELNKILKSLTVFFSKKETKTVLKVFATFLKIEKNTNKNSSKLDFLSIFKTQFMLGNLILIKVWWFLILKLDSRQLQRSTNCLNILHQLKSWGNFKILKIFWLIKVNSAKFNWNWKKNFSENFLT